MKRTVTMMEKTKESNLAYCLGYYLATTWVLLLVIHLAMRKVSTTDRTTEKQKDRH